MVWLAFIAYIKEKFCILLPDFLGINAHNKSTLPLIPESKKAFSRIFYRKPSQLSFDTLMHNVSYFYST